MTAGDTVTLCASFFAKYPIGERKICKDFIFKSFKIAAVKREVKRQINYKGSLADLINF